MRQSALVALAVMAVAAPAASAKPIAHAAATCSDYPNQAAAQRAADTRDADGDGIYCESLPCPCLKPGSGGTSPTPPPSPRPRAVTCGRERWAVKTLSDRRASRIDFTPKRTSVDALRSLEPPDVGRHSPRLPGEFSTYTVRARLRSFKFEEDSDIHLVIADPRAASKTMIVEFPHNGCVKSAGPKSRRRMARARSALVRACGQPGTDRFRLLSGTATITGVGFFDLIHGQRGVAPNGIELHPVLAFRMRTRCGHR